MMTAMIMSMKMMKAILTTSLAIAGVASRARPMAAASAEVVIAEGVLRTVFPLVGKSSEIIAIKKLAQNTCGLH